MDTRTLPDFPTVRTPAPATPAVWAPAPAQPTIYTPVPPPGLYAPRPDEVTQQLALLLAAHQYTLPAPAEPVDTRISGRAKSAALVAVAGGAGVGAGATGIGYAAGMIASASTGLMTAAIALAITTGSLFMLALLIRTTTSHRTPTSPGETHITQHITATGLFGRANGTINHH